MNSYNENLHSGVVASLYSQELDQKKLKAQLDASMFTLYYAEGAQIVAKEKLDDAAIKYQNKQAINNQAVECNTLSTNLLLSANQQKQYTATTVTNSAVTASNIQIAANAVVRLASDMGSIFSIINAADFGSQIYQQSKDAYDLINETAYDAETASQHAMEASAAIAEIAAATIADKAKNTNGSINNLLKITTSDLAAVVSAVETDYALLASTKVTTKLSEGITEYSKVEYGAAKKAYQLNNKELNMNLTVKENSKKNPKDGSYTVSFDYYTSPFSFSKDDQLNTIKNSVLENPVKSYNIMVVKENKKLIFSMSNAEELLFNSSQFIALPGVPNDPATISDNKTKVDTAIKAILISEDADKKLHDANKELADIEVKLKKEKTAAAEAVKKVKLAENIVKSKPTEANVAGLEHAIKHLDKINYDIAELETALVYAKDNVKSTTKEAAHAAPIALHDALLTEQHASIDISSAQLLDSDNDPITKGEKYVVFVLTVFTEEFKKAISIFDDYLSAPSETFCLTDTLLQSTSLFYNKLDKSYLNFTVLGNEVYDVEYRCIFLPYPDNLITGALLNNRENEVEIIEINQEIESTETKIKTLTNEKDILENEIKKLNNELKSTKSNDSAGKDIINQKTEDYTNSLNEIMSELEIAENEFDQLLIDKTLVSGHKEQALLNKKAFLFNLKLAENVSAGNYISVIVTGDEHNTHLNNRKHKVNIPSDTTDNFGTPLKDQAEYIPVILSYYNGLEIDRKKVINTLSDWENTQPFKYLETQK